MNTLSGLIGHVPAPAAYAIVAAAVLAESVLLVGAFVPTLTLLLTSGALVRAGDLNLALVIATASCAVVAGDAIGHRTGRLLSSRLRTGRMGRRIPAAAWQRAETLMTRRGGQAIFLARFVVVIRTLAPYTAGATGMPYQRIAPYSMLAAPPVGRRRSHGRLRGGHLAPAGQHLQWPCPRGRRCVDRRSRADHPLVP